MITKRAFLTNKVVYPGHVIRSGRLECANRTTDAILDLKKLKTPTERDLFIYLCNVFLSFFPSVALVASPLTVCLRKTQEKELGKLDEEELTTV